MPKFVIERELPGAGRMSDADFRGVSSKSCEVLRILGPETLVGQGASDFLPARADVLAGTAPVADVPDEAAREGAGACQAWRWAVQAPAALASPGAGRFGGHRVLLSTQYRMPLSPV